MPKEIEEKLDKTQRSYHFRHDTEDPIDDVYQKIKACLIKPVKKTIPYGLCIVGAENNNEGTNPHIHAKIDTNISMGTLRARLKKAFSCSGQSSYTLKYENKETNISYVMKGGNYRYCPEMEQKVLTAPKWVFKDQAIASFEKSRALLEDDYHKGDMSDYEFIYKLIGLYADHKKHIYIAHIRALWLGVANQRNKSLDHTYRYRVEGKGRPFRHRLVEEIMRGFYIYDN